jgi:di/tricarboxylate transporter
MLETGLSVAIGDAVLGVIRLERGADAANFAVLGLLSTFAGLITTNPSQPALLAPLAGHFAEATGWSIKASLMIMAVGFSNVILPYQVPPVVVGLQVARLPVLAAVPLTLALSLVSIIVLIPLNYLWWRLIGFFGG